MIRESSFEQNKRCHNVVSFSNSLSLRQTMEDKMRLHQMIVGVSNNKFGNRIIFN